jgi:hypothetical protein
VPSLTDRRILPRLAAAALAAVAAGCSEYLERRETISFHAGDATAVNRAIHTIDPWPAAAARTDIPVSGRRVVNAIERYEAPQASAPAAAGMPMIMLPPTGAAPAAGP